jgi:hypothetical protein
MTARLVLRVPQLAAEKLRREGSDYLGRRRSTAASLPCTQHVLAFSGVWTRDGQHDLDVCLDLFDGELGLVVDRLGDMTSQGAGDFCGPSSLRATSSRWPRDRHKCFLIWGNVWCPEQMRTADTRSRSPTWLRAWIGFLCAAVDSLTGYAGLLRLFLRLRVPLGYRQVRLSPPPERRTTHRSAGALVERNLPGTNSVPFAYPRWWAKKHQLE